MSVMPPPKRLIPAGKQSDAGCAVYHLICPVTGVMDATLARSGRLPGQLVIATFGDHELLDFLECPVLSVAQRHRDIAERVLELVLASLDENRNRLRVSPDPS